MKLDVSKLERLCHRFEIAVGNFGRSCVHSQSNEKAFQAWLAVCAIHEFGLSRVVREVHLDKKQLFSLIRRSPDFQLDSIIAGYESGNELFPDLSVMWEPDIDTRHSSTRNQEYADANVMLPEIAIITEFKVTGSTSHPTPRRQIVTDLEKLAVFRSAHNSITPIADGHRAELATYLVVLDNFCDANGTPCLPYSKDKMADLLCSVGTTWPSHIQKPTVLLLSPSSGGCLTYTFRNFILECD